MKPAAPAQNKIIKTIEEHKEYIRGCGVKKIGLFGSFSKGTQHKKSDLDFLVVFDSPTFDNYMDLKFFLEKIFKKNVDLVTEDNLKPAFKHVKGEAIYAKGI